MFTVELYARIRRAVIVEGLSRKEAAKWFGVHRNPVTKMLSLSVPPGYRRRERPASKKLGPYIAWIDLEGDSQVHKKQRHTAYRIFERRPPVTWIAGHYPKPIAFYKWFAEKGWDESQALKSAAGDKGSKLHEAEVGRHRPAGRAGG